MEFNHITLTDLGVFVAIGAFVWRVVMVIATIVEARLIPKLAPRAPICSVDAKVQSMEQGYGELRDFFRSVETKMESQHATLHKRVTQLAADLQEYRVELAKHYVTKEDLREMERRIINSSGRLK